MKQLIFILFVFTSLGFAQSLDINAKTQENREKLMEIYVDYNTNHRTFEKYKHSLWFEDEKFSRELLEKVYEHNMDDALQYIKNKNVLNDKALFRKIVKETNYYFMFASDTLKSDREYILSLIDEKYNIYREINKSFYLDREITLLSVNQSGFNLQYADEKFKNDKEVVLEAVKNYGDTLKYASTELKDDKEVVLEAVRDNGNTFAYASKRIKNDKKIVLKVLKNNPIAFKYVSKTLKADKKIVLEMVRRYGGALKYASDELKTDKEVVLEALKSTAGAFGYADIKMMKDKEVVLYFFKVLKKKNASNFHPIFMKIHPSLLDDDEVMLEAIGKNGLFLQYASKRLKQNKKMALKAVSQNGLALKYVDKSLREDKNIVSVAISNNPKANRYITKVTNRIKRKIHPLAWETYNIEDTLEILYGKDRVYNKSEDIHIKLPTNTSEHMNASGYGRLHIDTNKKVKSIAILQQKDGDRALTALYYPYGNRVNIALPLKILNAALTEEIKGMKVVVITETEDNYLFINSYNIYYSYICRNGYGLKVYIEDLRKDLNENILKTKYKINKNGAGYFKFMILHPMVSYYEAEKLNVKVNFVSHIRGSIKDNKLFDLYTSEYISKDPLIKIEFENMKLGEYINFSYSTINGETKSKRVKGKVAKK